MMGLVLTPFVGWANTAENKAEPKREETNKATTETPELQSAKQQHQQIIQEIQHSPTIKLLIVFI